MRVTVPVVNGSSAYDYEVSSSWSLVDADPKAGVYVYGFGTETELNEISPGDSTDPLTESFTMKGSITGAEFNAMGSIDISIDGYLSDVNLCKRAWKTLYIVVDESVRHYIYENNAYFLINHMTHEIQA